jgi:hypothetical protein
MANLSDKISPSGVASLSGATFTGVTSGPTPAAGTDTDEFATTAFVKAAIAAAAAGGGGGGGGGLYDGLMIVQDQRSSGTDGGRADPNYAKRTLQTIVENSITGASLASDLITLPAGSYHVSGWGAFYRVDETTMHLKDSSDTTEYVRASLVRQANSDVSGFCPIDGYFTLGSSTALGLWYDTTGDNGGNDLGIGRSDFDGPEVHCSLTFLKLA